jgi:aromatase
VAARTSNEIEIEAPFDLVWDVTNDIRTWPSLFSEYAAAEVLEERPGYVKFRLTMHPDENGQTWSWVSERQFDRDTKTVVARRTEPGPFEFMDLRWTYQEKDAGRTVMCWTQEFHLRPSAPVTDEEMAAQINTNSPVQMKLIKAALETRHAARPPAG